MGDLMPSDIKELLDDINDILKFKEVL